MEAGQVQANRKPGRPSSKGSFDSRQALIDAARELFAGNGYDEVSIKRIADAAGVNPAMIQYHFGGKSGLLETAFDEAIAPVVAELGTLSSRGGRIDLGLVFDIYMRTMAANPWLPKMFLQHVLPEGGRLQERAAQRIAAGVEPAIRGLIKRGQTNGELRPNLDPKFTTISLVSLALFPFLAQPVINRVLGLELDGPLTAEFVRHTSLMFHRGAGVDHGG